MLRRAILGAVMLVGLVSGASADLWKYNGWNNYYLAGFEKSVQGIRNNLSQSKTGRTYSCGVTSALFSYNYLYYREVKQNLYVLSSLSRARNEITRLYQRTNGLSGNGSTSNSTLKTWQPLIDIAEDEYGIMTVLHRSKDDTFAKNMNYMISDLKINLPVIVSLKSGPDENRKDSHSLNPVGNFAHVVIVTGYFQTTTSMFLNDDIVSYFDPFYGGNHWMTFKEFKNQVNLDNLDYLRY